MVFSARCSRREKKGKEKKNTHHNHEDVAGRVDNLMQSHDVRMSTELENVDLSLHLLFHIQSLDLASVQNFHGDLVPSQHVLAHCKHTHE